MAGSKSGDGSPERFSGSQDVSDNRKGKQSDSRPQLTISTTSASKSPDSPAHQLSAMSGDLAFGIKKKSSKEGLSSQQEENFPWDSALSSRSDLTDLEKLFEEDAGQRRLDRIKTDRERFHVDIKELREQHYTIATNMMFTAMHAAKRIYDLGEGSLEVAEDAATAMAKSKGDPLHLEKYHRLVSHYNETRNLTAYIGMKAGHDLTLQSVPDTSPSAVLDENLTVVKLVPKPDKGPIEVYNSKRSELKIRIDTHHNENDRYEREHPHLDKRFKPKPFGYGETDPKKMLPPEIPYLPPLEKALEEKIWESYLQVREAHPPARTGLADRHLDLMFSRSPAQWAWDNKEGYYKLNFDFNYKPAGESTRRFGEAEEHPTT